MVRLILISLGLTALTVFIHGVGTLYAIQRIIHCLKKKQFPIKLLSMEFIIIQMVCILLLLHLMEIFVWAGYYRISGLLPDYETAAYFSTVSYTTVGYGDVVLSGARRLLGPIESVVGVLMLGWSTGIIVAVLTRLFATRFSSSL